MIKFAKDSLKLDVTKIIEDSKKSLKVAAVISKAGVYDYDDGIAFKSKDELRKAVKTVQYAKLTINNHPSTLVIMSQEQLYGGVEKPFLDEDKIRAILAFDKELTPTAFLQKVRLAASGVGEPMDNSIGFYYRPDYTPGVAPDVNTGKMRKYDYAMRDIMVDHVAAGAFEGRCTAPSCGIGVDLVMRRIALDPFGEYKDFQDCVNHNQDKKNPAAFCAWLHKKITGKYPGESSQDAVLFSLIGDITKLDRSTYALIFGDAERPPKAWFDNCKSKARSFADDPGAFCGWLWYHGPEALKTSFGSSSVSIKGVKTKMSQEEETAYARCVREKKAEGMSDDEAREACKELKTDQDEESAYEKCVREKKAEGMTDAEAREACQAKKTDQEKLESAYEKCLVDKKAEGMTQEEAEAACEALKPAAQDQEKTPWQLCIQEEMAAGKTKEQARMACKEKGLKGPMQEKDQETVAQPVESEEVMPTPLETCIATRMEAHGEDEATAKKWCEDDAAGKHQPVSTIVDNINRLRAKKRQLNR